MQTPEQNNSSSDLPAHEANSWERIAGELRACREAQKRIWGELDSSTLGRYLAGEVEADERGRVERELAEYPELRQLTDLVRDVLSGLPEMEFPASPLKEEAVTQPAILSFRQAREQVLLPRRKVATLVRRYGSLAAAACLLVSLGWLTPRESALRATMAAPTTKGDEVAVLGPAMASTGDVIPLFTTVQLPFVRGPVADPPMALSGGAAPVPRAIGAFNGEAVVDIGPQVVRASEAARFHRQGREQLRDGKVVDAERSLSLSYSWCQQQLGPRHPYTNRAARDLAGVYAPVLNNKVGVWDVDRRSGGEEEKVAIAPTMYIHPASRGEVLRLREQLQSQNLTQVQNNVVPVLVGAFQTSSNSGERQEIVKALGSLGAAAAPAIPALEQKIRNVSAIEKREILMALVQIGPSAVASLERLAGDPSKDSSRRSKLSESDRKLVEYTLTKLKAPEGMCGVADDATCLSFRQIRTASMQIRRLHREQGVAVLIETRTATSNTRFALQHLGKRGVHVVIDPGKNTVEVNVCPSLQKAGFSVKAVKDSALSSCSERDFDGACEAALGRIREQSQRLKK